MWIKTSDRKPEEGQSVNAIVKGRSLCTDGVGGTFYVEHEPVVLQSFFTKNTYPSETGHFLDGFAFDDGSYPGIESKVIFWMPIPEIPKDL